jgi:TIR domain-containing protein
MPRVFISYRRTEKPRAVKVLYQQLANRLGEAQVFSDITKIHVADKFRDRIFDAIDDCDLFILMVGSRTFSELGENGRRRIDDPQDWVRQEVLRAMRRKVPIVPVLLNGSSPLTRKQLPRKLAKLADIQAMSTRNRLLSSVVTEIVNALPKLRVEFEMKSGKPVASPDYVIEFSVQNAPEWAKWIQYKLDDEENVKPTRLATIKETDWTTTYGDYEIGATLLNRPPRQKPRRRPIPPILLSKALRETHGRKNSAIQQAIREISKN